jgi:uncharacterized protein
VDDVGVFPEKQNALVELFGRPKVLIGTIHSLALPGAPQHRGQSFEEIVDFAVAEARRYAEGGFHAVLVENAWDLPFAKPEDLGHETAAAMSVLTDRVRREVGLPTGVNVLANGARCAIAVAAAGGGTFIRVNQWVNGYVANEGFVEGRSGEVARYRSDLRADHVRVFADVHVKHGSHAIVGDRSLAEQAMDAEFFDADVLIATGNRTGGPTDVSEIRGIREGSDLPVIVGSGVGEDNAEETFEAADGAIIASWVKQDGVWWNPVDPARVERLAKIADRVW